MKRSPIVILVTLMLSLGSYAQTTGTFDIATFQIPKGWGKQVSESSFQISTQDRSTGAFCLINVFKSVAATNTSREDFDTAWEAIVRGTIDASAVASMQPSTNPEDGWKAETGSASFEKDGTKGVVVLVSVRGFGRVINTLILTNSDEYQPTIAAFLGSAVLKKPEQSAPATKSQTNAAPTSSLSVTSYNWKQSQSRKDPMGGYAGYSANTYQFLANNTYKFSQVTFQNYAPKYYLEDEEGTYKINGNTITLTPKKAAFRTYRSSRQDQILKSGNIALESVQYNFEFMNLNNNWTLLLSPVDGVETKRDGQFSFWLNGEKRKTYSYNSVNAQGELIT